MASIRRRAWTHNGETRTAWVLDYVDSGGTRRLKTFATKAAATTWATTAMKEVVDGVHVADRASVTVADAAKAWLAGRRAEGLERSTIESYENLVDRYIVPRIGATRIPKLTTPEVGRFADDLLASVTRPMARRALQALRMILSDAQRRGWAAVNAAAPVSIPTRSRTEQPVEAGRDYPTIEEIRAILDKATGRWRPLIITAVFSGLRASELRGLMWTDVDFENRVIRVRRRADQWNQLGAPKSATSTRDVPMAPMVQNVLKEWRLACPRVKRDKDDPGELRFVFPNGHGRVETLQNILKRGFGPTQVEAGVARPVLDAEGRPKLNEKGQPVRTWKYGLHGCRHFYASWLIEQGFQPKKVQAYMGHSSIEVTFDVYGHLLEGMDDDHAKLEAGELALVAPQRDKGATRT